MSFSHCTSTDNASLNDSNLNTLDNPNQNNNHMTKPGMCTPSTYCTTFEVIKLSVSTVVVHDHYLGDLDFMGFNFYMNVSLTWIQ